MGRISEYIKVALRNIRGSLLRSILTCVIIALGISALVGIQTAISSLGNSLGDLFSPFGTNQFTISNRANSFSSEGERKINPILTFEEAETFKKYYNFPSKVSTSLSIGGWYEIRGNNEKTNPNYSIIGIDNYYLELNNHEISVGREFSTNELASGVNVAIIPMGLKDALFPDYSVEEVIDKKITAQGQRYRIVGVLENKGEGFGGSTFMMIPIHNMNIHFATPRSNYTVKVGVQTNEAIEPAISEAKGIMRLARGLRVIDEDNFAINNPNAADKQLKDVTGKVSMGGFLIGLVTLSGAAIGLMNILLVSVTERVREIGISKALGASVGSIRMQYFLEGMFISLFGGILGIIVGLLVGLGVAKATNSNFVIPWGWIILGLVICLIVGLVSSIYPALKASRLNPIEALRQD